MSSDGGKGVGWIVQRKNEDVHSDSNRCSARHRRRDSISSGIRVPGITRHRRQRRRLAANRRSGHAGRACYGDGGGAAADAPVVRRDERGLIVVF
jgi:hypothetical protein